jgi:glutathione S-transferase
MTEPAARTLWGVGTSRTLRAHWALIELGLDYRTNAIRPRTSAMDDAAFRMVSPSKKVPVLQDEGITISESPAIVLYLGEKYATPDVCLVPSTIPERARLFEWVSYISMELDATSLYVLRRHLDLAETYGEAPAAVDTARQYFARMIEKARHAVQPGNTYLLGGRFSAADILLVSCFNMADRFGAKLPAEIAEYRAHICARPAYELAMKANNP